jgi:TolB-like protein
MDRVIIGVLALALGYFALDKFVLSRRADTASSDAGSATTAATRPRSLAVLPFASPGEDAESNALAGGLHDTLITQLSKLNGLEVRSRTSVMKFKDWTGGLKPIAQELAVNVVLEGTVQRQGNRAVVNAQLIDARTDAHLWAETFDRTSDDVFALQAEIAQRVVQSLEVALSPQERKVLTEAPTENRAAYALFVQAQRELNEGQVSIPEAQNEARRKRGAEMLEKAVAADPKFALAWAALSRAYATLAWDTMYGDYRAYGDKARAAAERAVALGADLPEAHFASGSVAMQLDLDFPRAMREFELAVRGAPRRRAVPFAAIDRVPLRGAQRGLRTRLPPCARARSHQPPVRTRPAERTDRPAPPRRRARAGAGDRDPAPGRVRRRVRPGGDRGPHAGLARTGGGVRTRERRALQGPTRRGRGPLGARDGRSGLRRLARCTGRGACGGALDLRPGPARREPAPPGAGCRGASSLRGAPRRSAGDAPRRSRPVRHGERTC